MEKFTARVTATGSVQIVSIAGEVIATFVGASAFLACFGKTVGEFNNQK